MCICLAVTYLWCNGLSYLLAMCPTLITSPGLSITLRGYQHIVPHVDTGSSLLGTAGYLQPLVTMETRGLRQLVPVCDNLYLCTTCTCVRQLVPVCDNLYLGRTQTIYMRIGQPMVHVAWWFYWVCYSGTPITVKLPQSVRKDRVLINVFLRVSYFFFFFRN